MNTSSLQSIEYATYYKPYIEALGEVELMNELEHSFTPFIDFLKTIPTEKQEYRYAEGKWTIKDIIQHIIDAERIFGYRALRISRNDQTPLSGFEENDYVENTDANSRSIQGLLTELSALRHSNLLMFKSFTEEQLTRMGTASNHSISVRALGFLIIGHQKHHQKVFQERYL